MVNVFCILKVQVIHANTSLRMPIINQCDNLLVVVVDSTPLSGFQSTLHFSKRYISEKKLEK